MLTNNQEILKEILYKVFVIDMQISKFNNRMSSMNFNYALANLQEMPDVQLNALDNALTEVANNLLEINPIISKCESSISALVRTYDSSTFEEK